MGVTATVHCITHWVLLLSCDYVLKFDWYCQLSGSGSSSLNSQKLPGRFSYRLGTRLGVVGSVVLFTAWYTFSNIDQFETLNNN